MNDMLVNVFTAILFLVSILVVFSSVRESIKHKKMRRAINIILECAAIKNHGVNLDSQIEKLKNRKDNIVFSCQRQIKEKANGN